MIKQSVMAVSMGFFMASCAQASEQRSHYPGVFIGYTHAQSETHFTYGFEYEYRFEPSWGLGLLYEKTPDAHHGDGTTLILGEFYYHPDDNLRFGIGAGKERIGGHHPHSENVIQLNASYDIHFGDFGIAPTVAVDFIDGEKAYVFGVSVMRPF